MIFIFCFFALFLFSFTRCFILNIHRVCKYLCIDIFEYFKMKKWKIWNGFGLNIYIGMFGTGKSLSASSYVCRQANKYSLNVLSNVKLYGVEYTELINYKQIIDAPPNTIIYIDEISTVFNARSWKDFNINLLFQLLQCRKNRKEIVATAQRFSHVDKLLRDITYNIINCSKIWRFCHLQYFDAWDYENMQNVNYLKRLKNIWYFVTSKHYKQYDTSEIINNTKKTDFLSNDDILNSRGATQFNELAVSSKGKKLKKYMKKK